MRSLRSFSDSTQLAHGRPYVCCKGSDTGTDFRMIKRHETVRSPIIPVSLLYSRDKMIFIEFIFYHVTRYVVDWQHHPAQSDGLFNSKKCLQLAATGWACEERRRYD